MPTRVYLVPPCFYPENADQCHIVSYADDLAQLEGFFSGAEIDEIQALANEVNEDFAMRTADNGRITLLPRELVQGSSQGNALQPFTIIEMMLELWARRMGNKMPSTVVFVISNMWNPDITALHQRWAVRGYNLRRVKDLYVWTM